MSRTPRPSTRPDDDRLAPLGSYSLQHSLLSISSGVQSQIGARWGGDFPTTINSGFSNLGTPRSMGRKPVREGREGAIGQKPLPETLLRALELRSVTEEERKMREVEEQAKDRRRMLQKIQNQRDILEESQKKLASDVLRFINRGSLEQSSERKNDPKALKATIRELKEDLDNYEAMVRTKKHEAAARDFYDEQFTTFVANTKTMRVLVNSTAKRLNRHLEAMQEVTPKQKTIKILITDTRREQAATTSTVDLGLSKTSPDQQESLGSHEWIVNTAQREKSDVPPAGKPPDIAEIYKHQTALEDTVCKKLTDITEESTSLMAQLVHLMPTVIAYMSTSEEPANSSQRTAVRARLLSIESRSNKLRNKLMMGFPEMETGRLKVEDLATVAPNVEAICRAVGGLLSALAPKRGQVVKKDLPAKCKEAGRPGAVHRTCTLEEKTDDDERYALLMEGGYLCEWPTNDAYPPSPSASSMTLVDTETEDQPEQILSIKPALRPLLLVDTVTKADAEPAIIISPSIRTLFTQSIQYQALQRTLVPDVAVLEHCKNPWSFGRVMQVKGLLQTLEELLKNVMELQSGLKEAENYEDEDDDGGKLMTSIKHHSQMAKEMKSEVSAMIRSVLHSEHCQKNLDNREEKTVETPRKSMREWLNAREETPGEQGQRKVVMVDVS